MQNPVVSLNSDYTYSPRAVRFRLRHFNCDLRYGRDAGACSPRPYVTRRTGMATDASYVTAAATVADLNQGIATLSRDEKLGVSFLVARGPVEKGRGTVPQLQIGRKLHRNPATLKVLAKNACERIALALGWEPSPDVESDYPSDTPTPRKRDRQELSDRDLELVTAVFRLSQCGKSRRRRPNGAPTDFGESACGIMGWVCRIHSGRDLSTPCLCSAMLATKSPVRG